MFGRKKRSQIPQNYVYTRTKKKQKKIALKILYIFLILLALGALFYFFFISSYFDIKYVNISGNETVSKNNINNIYEELSSGDSYFLKNKNTFVFKASALANDIKNKFKRVQDVRVSRLFPASLNITIKEYSPFGVSCVDISKREGVSDYIKTGCFYFNEEGIVFDQAPDLEGNIFIFVKDSNVSGENLPQSLYSKDDVYFMYQFKDAMSKYGLPLEYFALDDKFHDVEALTKEGFKVFLTMDLDPKEEALSLYQILNNEVKDRMAELDYVDLRIQNRAYYKFKETGTTTPETLK